MQLAMRIIGMIVGLIASMLMLLVDALYSLTNALGRVAGVSADTTHFFWGLLVTIIGFVGALVAPFSWVTSVALMLVSTVAFFFVVGFWAIIPAVFYVIAMLLVASDRGSTTSPRAPTGV